MKVKNVTTTMNTPLEEVLKEAVMESLFGDKDEAKGKPVPTPKQIGGLTNLGKTFIWSGAELETKRQYVEAQMV